MFVSTYCARFVFFILSYFIQFNSLQSSYYRCQLKHVPNFKEKLQLQKDAGPEICLQNSFERTTVLGFRDQSGRSGTDKLSYLLDEEFERIQVMHLDLYLVVDCIRMTAMGNGGKAFLLDR